MSSGLRRWWRRARYRRIQARLAGPKLVRAFSDACPEPYFVEIGSNDGEQHDHLRPFIEERGWRGLMVEPVPYVFERLRRNYGTIDRVALENAAITDRDGRMRFYYLADASPEERAGLPSWYDGVGSFSYDTVRAHGDEIPEIEGRIVHSDVPCMTFESLCRRHHVDRVDLLVVDTEGHDWEIIRTIDFARYTPRLLIYEHFHLSRIDRAECRRHLGRSGYETMEEGFDTFCLHTREDDELSRRWRRLRPAVPGVALNENAA